MHIAQKVRSGFAITCRVKPFKHDALWQDRPAYHAKSGEPSKTARREQFGLAGDPPAQ
ncbi:hypothetical protein [Mesorhizobium sanjuanii]|uniref:hypothetical protein n=1 Tax=Mesorhizobium sanjuanii TaxID=2037900 RepID=UPI0013FE4222|nr:hypothetical protein [Mesorhizobium sanjuanii]